jgi:[acyl-carrier-protein] S-malonyltransferase
MTFAVLCSGQGGQHAAMLDLIAGTPDAEDVLARAASVLGADVRTWLREPDTLLTNRFAQPLICSTQLAIWAALEARLPSPSAFAGYSVGELASYACAGALDPEELCRLASRRAESMDAAAPSGGLLAVSGLTRSRLADLMAARQLWIAIVNGEDAFVVGGSSHDVAALAPHAAALGAKVTPLAIGVAAHTPLMTAAVLPFRETLAQSTLRAPKVPVLAGVDGSWVTDRAGAVAKLAAQLSATIEWSHCIDALAERGCHVFLELGPGSALTHMIRRRLGDAFDARSVEDFRSLDGIATWVAQRSRL